MLKHRHLATSLTAAICTAAALNVAAADRQPTSQRPALVVGIIVDGLDANSVDMLREHFTAGGFNRLLDKGAVIADLDYGSYLDPAAATAVAYSGASPAVNGITAAITYNPGSRQTLATFHDASTLGNFTDETYSPSALRVSTLTDELRIAGAGIGYAHTIAADAATALAAAAHASNSAVWIDDRTGRWASTTFYPELPSAAQTVNHYRPLSARLDTLRWQPSIPQSALQLLPQPKRLYGFSHIFAHNNPDRYRAYKQSAPANSDITSLAGEYIKSMTLGSRDAVDMLNLAYSLQPFAYSSDADTRAETIDSYLRLDRDLQRLFAAIDAGPGMDRTLVFLVGTPMTPLSPRDDERWSIPSGDFSPARAVSLLKVNLMSLYGNGDWVKGYHDGQIYLNRELIHERGKSLDEMRRETASFMRLMSGVTHAMPVDEIVDGNIADTPFPPARNIDIDTAGDVFVAIAPGWRVVDELSQSQPRVVRAANSSSMAIIMAPSVAPGTITTPVDARAIAPTVASLLHIRSPNGAALRPLRL